jgi:hypothetical protein
MWKRLEAFAATADIMLSCIETKQLDKKTNY